MRLAATSRMGLRLFAVRRAASAGGPARGNALPDDAEVVPPTQGAARPHSGGAGGGAGGGGGGGVFDHSHIPPPPGFDANKALKTDPFAETWAQRLSPSVPNFLNILVGFFMVVIAYKSMRMRGEHLEAEKRLRERLQTTRMEIEELKDKLPEAIVSELTQLKKRDDASIRVAVEKVTAEHIESVKESAVTRFEKSLWQPATDATSAAAAVASSAAAAVAPPPAAAAAGGAGGAAAPDSDAPRDRPRLPMY